MLQEITMSPATLLVIAAIIAWIVWAVRRLIGKGLCDCHDACDGCSKRMTSKRQECPHCDAVESMILNMEASLEASDKQQMRAER